MRTPAMQAGLASKRLNFRMVFMSSCGDTVFVVVTFDIDVVLEQEYELRMAA
jgi:hypothetical protein